ncbi:MAG: DUF1015 domain-containing protein [Candidatus Marinimicrobia bacterium]|nr:DUF1015 domain-containing protein [Candidatus Neomarinimicrobiota bacterium]
MAIIHTLAAVLFRPEKAGDVTQFVAPPYDVIPVEGRKELLERSPHNIVRLILPEAGEGNDRYQQAARLYRRWRDKGILQVDRHKGLYIWEQEFTIDGQPFTRRALVAKVTCGPYQPGGVMRHELTQAGPKADRLALFEATDAQFSQMFGIFPDQGGDIRELLAEATQAEPCRTAGYDQGQVSRLYRIAEPAVIQSLKDALAGLTITMADGHHRYETTRTYYERRGYSGTALMTLVPGSDPGLAVLPTHRVTTAPVEAAKLQETLADHFEVAAYDWSRWQELYAQLRNNNSTSGIVAVAPAEKLCFQIGWAATSPAGEVAASRGEVAVLHETLLPQLEAATQPGEPLVYNHHHQAEAAVREAADQGQWAFLLRPVSVQRLFDLADRQAVLPPKSTYFYPKFLSGFVNADLD